MIPRQAYLGSKLSDLVMYIHRNIRFFGCVLGNLSCLHLQDWDESTILLGYNSCNGLGSCQINRNCAVQRVLALNLLYTYKFCDLCVLQHL
jgi:hypothetical protein